MSRYSVETIFRAVDRMTAPISRMQSGINRFTRRAESGLRRVSDMTWNLSKTSAAVATALGGAFMTAAGGIAYFVTEANRANGEINEMSKAMGVSALSARAAESMLKPMGMTWENYTDLIEELGNKMGELKNAKEMKKLQEAIGFTTLDMKKLMNLKPEEQFTRIMDSLAKMKDTQKAQFIADEIFGGEGNKFISALKARGLTFTDLIENYKKYNFYSKEGEKATAAFNNAMGPLTTVASSAKSQIAALTGGALVPYIQKATEWAAANKELINSKIEQFAKGLADSLVWVVVNFSEIVTWVKRVAIGIGIFLALTAVLKTFVLIMTVVNMVMMMNPIGLIVIAVVALIAVIAYLINKFFGLQGVIAAANGVLMGIGAAILVAMGPIGWLIGAAVLIWKNWGVLSGFFSGLWAGIVSVFQGAQNIIMGIINGIIAAIDNVISKATSIGSAVKGFFGFGGGGGDQKQAAAAGGRVASPQERTAKSVTENNNHSTVTIHDKTGRAKMSGKPGNGVRLVNTGTM